MNRHLLWILGVLSAVSPWEAQAADPFPNTQPSARPRVVPAPRVRQQQTIGAEEAVNLGTLNSSPGSSPSGASSIGTPVSPGGGMATVATAHGPAPQLGEKSFKIYFDLWLMNQPGVTDYSFVNVHSYFFLDALPSKEVTFSFDVSSARGGPSFFELDYQVLPTLQLRFGKIWIPFDDLSPHNLFGGRINVSLLSIGGDPFLPDLWTELGVGARYRIIDRLNFNLEGQLYYTNGFGSGGNDPVSPGSPYPKLGDTSLLSKDNNRDKAVGGRLSTLIGRRLGLGLSYYTGRWSDQSMDPYRINMIGADAQIRMSSTGTELRGGIVSMDIGAPSGDFKRGGWYLELGQKFGTKRDWKILGRGGYRQLDNRVIAVTDQKLVGATLLWRPNFIQWSIEHSRDLDDVEGKINYTFTAVRMAMEF